MFKYSYFYSGLKFMLVVGGINSELIGINTIMFNYSYHSILTTEYNNNNENL